MCVRNGYKVIVITNQRNVPKITYDSIHAYMKQQLPGIDAVYVCPHEEGTCTCRKPFPGLFYYAEQDFDIDKSKSWMIGGSVSDIEAGESYGINTKLTENLYETVKEIMQCEC